jgi:hypothetical protein
MSFFNKKAVHILTGLLLLVLATAPGCRTTLTESSSTASTAAIATTSLRFADGVKAVRINTHNHSASNPSFPSSVTLPASTPIPTPFPGADGTETYLPGISADHFYEMNGTTGLSSKPDWLLDFQLGVTATSATGECAAFGGGSTPLDPANYYRVAEKACATGDCAGNACMGTGSGNDKVFFRIVLDRDTTKIGSAENLLIQVEYQASALHLNSDANGLSDVEDSLDQLWKIHWSDSLASSATPKTFGVFVPMNYSACLSSGNGTTDAPGYCPKGTPNSYRGSPVKVRQFMIPLAAYPDMKVIQFTRMKGRVDQTTGGGATSDGSAYIDAFCDNDEPLCLGVVIRSVSIMRI